tara:strand:- start:121 stop:345 length:225 start_codon:yes stop_codon:yes gene_type:complete
MKVNKKKIFQIVSKNVKIPLSNIGEDFSTENIETWDSLAHVRIILELQKITNIKIPTSSYGDFNSIEKLIKKFT